MDPSGVPGFTYDQMDDPAQADPTPGGAQGDGWPMGISHVPAVVPLLLAKLGIPQSAVISRGYGVITGAAHTTVTTLTVFTGSTQGTDPVSTIVVFDNPFGAQDPASGEHTRLRAGLADAGAARSNPVLGDIEDAERRDSVGRLQPARAVERAGADAVRSVAAGRLRRAARARAPFRCCFRHRVTMTATGSPMLRTFVRRSLIPDRRRGLVSVMRAVARSA